MKYYFKSSEDPLCYPLSAHKDYMTQNGIKQMEVFQAKMETGTGYFFCREFGEVGTVGEGCGKACSKYSPRNGKNGRCRFSGNVYQQTEIKKMLTI